MFCYRIKMFCVFSVINLLPNKKHLIEYPEKSVNSIIFAKSSRWDLLWCQSMNSLLCNQNLLNSRWCCVNKKCSYFKIQNGNVTCMIATLIQCRIKTSLHLVYLHIGWHIWKEVSHRLRVSLRISASKVVDVVRPQSLLRLLCWWLLREEENTTRI